MTMRWIRLHIWGPLKRFFHIHMWREVGHTSQHGPTWTGWSLIYRCRCGAEKLVEM